MGTHANAVSRHLRRWGVPVVRNDSNAPGVRVRTLTPATPTEVAHIITNYPAHTRAVAVVMPFGTRTFSFNGGGLFTVHAAPNPRRPLKPAWMPVLDAVHTVLADTDTTGPGQREILRAFLHHGYATYDRTDRTYQLTDLGVLARSALQLRTAAERTRTT